MPWSQLAVVGLALAGHRLGNQADARDRLFYGHGAAAQSLGQSRLGSRRRRWDGDDHIGVGAGGGGDSTHGCSGALRGWRWALGRPRRWQHRDFDLAGGGRWLGIGQCVAQRAGGQQRGAVAAAFLGRCCVAGLDRWPDRSRRRAAQAGCGRRWRIGFASPAAARVSGRGGVVAAADRGSRWGRLQMAAVERAELQLVGLN